MNEIVIFQKQFTCMTVHLNAYKNYKDNLKKLTQFLL